MPHVGITVLGAGLAGSEAAWQLASRDLRVTLVEMRPETMGPAHHTGSFAELVCSNSLKGTDPATAAGLLKRELRTLGSLVLACAEATAVPAGSALAVDRQRFASLVTKALVEHPLITVERREATGVPDDDYVLVATGPLTTDALQRDLSARLGEERLSFYDAAAPIVDAATVDMARCFPASRYGKGGGADYLNCPLSEAEYTAFVEALASADRVEAKPFEAGELFAACMPVEEIARKGVDTLRHGAMKPVGLEDPRTGLTPHAVVQLRAETAVGSAYNLVGFQTNLTFAEQRRVFGMIPGLEDATLLRYGVMHRNSFIDAPRLLDPDLSLRSDPSLFFAGQIVGTEGYLEAAATGLLAAVNIAARADGRGTVVLPATTALGSLVAYATDPDTEPYQPMHVNFGLVPKLDPPVSGKRRRYAAYSARAAGDLASFLETRRCDLGRPRLPDLEPVAGPRASR
jgi:methylenetetrahydrofolate--tRNA-(uracil-5-)-methyltransferase